VYEINRNFRNEGVSTQHNPEFTMLEFYQAYANYHDLMDLTEELVKFVAMDVNGTTIARFQPPKGPNAGKIVEIDLGKWQRLSMREAIVRFWPKSLSTQITLWDLENEDRGAAFVQKVDEELEHGIFPTVQMEVDGVNTRELWERVMLLWSSEHGKAVALLFELLAEPHLIHPTIIYDYPLAVSPLSKAKPDEPEWVERFEFYIGGFELGNGFSELNDPVDQERRFTQQLAERQRGDEEAHQPDEDYVRALAYGLPPTAGEGIGIDRLTMILTGARSIRDVILFPLMRPAKEDASQKDKES
jgi:lysyl-tRNA synthetase class 2